ncbi:Multidrug resistance protein MdtB [Marinobacterium sp. xm-d-579]|jgi:multidrug efflux pump subunit AcrB|uniref:efflux RND transporter permease subunit n=1 Tax=Marinobacterium sp. xm-d-579 TaxID=2497734 RepID=UPI001569348B|nr:efflux RND transporter permease subunit [Marinobacterium sp. xm-d-579]NRP35321.1 Multidrug resistance protein MdtB [Marinobacterium sp. xm-d-579]
MKKFNLSDWALSHRSFVWFLMIVSLVAGIMAYNSIGREEDPNFAIKTMIISASLPGASIDDTVHQVTDRVEEKLKELPELDFTRTITRPGTAIIYVNLLPTTKPKELPRLWQKVRNMMADIRGDFPAEFQGFKFNDDFGDVFGIVYAFTADGFTPREVRDYAKQVKRSLQALPDTGKVDLIGTQEEVISLEFSSQKLAALGLNKQAVLATLQAQNAILLSGTINAGPETVLVRTSGQFSDVESLAAVNLRVGDRFFRLTDVASIHRGYKNPPSELFRYNGKSSIGLAIGMKPGANVIQFGEEVSRMVSGLEQSLPIGVSIHKVANQPQVAEEAVSGFIRALFEAVAIVLIVSFVSLGLRAGLVVSVTIPLVLAITFLVMNYSGISLQRISLGALIIALGLLVDDAMIAIETMISRLEKGDSLTKAASYAWTSIAFPMLTGTLVTTAGFIPVGLNNSNAGEYTFSLFVVIAVSLIVSWIAAVLFAPLLGVTMLPKNWAHNDATPGLARRAFHSVLRGAMRFRWLTIGLTVAAFAVSLLGMRFVEQQFFPTSDRPELIVDITLPDNATIASTQAVMDRIDASLAEDPDKLFWASYLGTGAPRFVLSFDVQTPSANMGQIVIQTPSVEARDRLKAKIEAMEEDFPGIDIYVKFLEVGPPVGRPVQYRLSGPDANVLRDKARELAALLSADTRLDSIVFDWSEPGRVIRVDILQDKLRLLGLTAQDVASVLQTVYSGQNITQLRDDTYLVDIQARGDNNSRNTIEALNELQFSSLNGDSIPLSSVALIRYDIEAPVIYQRDQMPTITVSAAINGSEQPATLVNALSAKINDFASKLPIAYQVKIGGAVESSAESQAPIAAVVPLMMLIMLTLVMAQMQSFRLTFIVFCAAPLGLIGVVAALLPTGAPLGFVAILGVLALIGILIRNSIILVEEIEALHHSGQSRWQAVFHASDSRARPIMLTAAAASLALIPIAREIFWGPMAIAMMGGIIVGTVVTLVFVPALYLAVFRVTPET